MDYPQEDVDARGQRSRAFVATINNYTEEHISQLKALPTKYLCFGKEVAPTTGTPHLQVYMYFKNALHWSALRSKIDGWYLAVAKGNTTQNKEYCSKEGEFYEQGVPPKDKLDNNERFEEALKLAKENRVDEIDAEMQIRYYKSLTSIAESQVQVDPPGNLEGTVFGEWKWGPPGTGKSHDARAENPGFYIKDISTTSMNYWCDYEGEETVIIEDIDASNGMRLAYYIKVWVDKYPFRARKMYQRGQLIRPKKFVFTSNYSPDVIFAQDPVLLAAIRRRLKVVRYCVLGEGLGDGSELRRYGWHQAPPVPPAPLPSVDWFNCDNSLDLTELLN